MFNELKGGFSDRVWMNREIQYYLEDMDGNPYGWLGHESRTDELDRMLEQCIYEEIISEEDFSDWICSKYGRWYGDMIYGESVEYAKNVFIRQLNKM